MSDNPPRWRLCLYVAGEGDLAARARSNLAEAVDSQLKGHDVNLEVVDVLASPTRAVEDQVILTPMLRILEPRPEVTLVGDLSNQTRLKGLLSPDRHDEPGGSAFRAALTS